MAGQMLKWSDLHIKKGGGGTRSGPFPRLGGMSQVLSRCHPCFIRGRGELGESGEGARRLSFFFSPLFCHPPYIGTRGTFTRYYTPPPTPNKAI